MGKSPDQIYGEIETHRRRMTTEINRLEHRVQDDISQVKERTLSHAPKPPSFITDRASEHPLASMAVAFGIGVAAGVLSESAGGLFPDHGRSNGRHSRNGFSARNQDNGAGFLSAGLLTTKLVEIAADTVRPLIDDVVAGFKGDERPAAERNRGDYNDQEQAEAMLPAARSL
jgi:hypothetical protein